MLQQIVQLLDYLDYHISQFFQGYKLLLCEAFLSESQIVLLFFSYSNPWNPLHLIPSTAIVK